jgi:hypothetical protein
MFCFPRNLFLVGNITLNNYGLFPGKWCFFTEFLTRNIKTADDYNHVTQYNHIIKTLGKPKYWSYFVAPRSKNIKPPELDP